MTQTLAEKMKARSVGLRGLDSKEVQDRANAVFRKICKTASEYEASGDAAADIAEAAIYKHSSAMAGLMGTIDASVPGGLSRNRDEANAAHETAAQVFLKFKADISGYLKQQIIEFRAARLQ